ncbi:MAG: DUF1294 domain-containing protein [Methanomicrobiaceae archaeon]|nr:DUF1294 domain-containing protein [Methanomicrobiaceae archaeon]
MNPVLIIVVGYILLNIIALLAFAIDKRKARKGKWRTPEKTLLILSLIGPFGAVFGMKLFRHKTMKLKFKLVYLFVILHLLAIGTIIFMKGQFG